MSLIYSGYFKLPKKGVPQKVRAWSLLYKGPRPELFEVHIFNNRTIYLFQSHNQYKQSKHLFTA